MNGWKQAFTIAKLELKASVFSFLFALAFVLFLIYTLVSTFDAYMDNRFVFFDLIFILIFSFAPVWMTPKDFQIQKINGDLMASPILVMQNQLPISQEVLVKSRFIIHFFYSFPFQLLTVVALYTISPLQSILSFGSFITFAIMWFAFGVYVGYAIPYGDAGEKFPAKNDAFIVIFNLLFFTGVFLVFTFFHILFGNGIIYWSIALAENWPILSSAISIILAIAGYHHYKFYMKRKMDKIDYL